MAYAYRVWLQPSPSSWAALMPSLLCQPQWSRAPAGTAEAIPESHIRAPCGRRRVHERHQGIPASPKQLHKRRRGDHNRSPRPPRTGVDVARRSPAHEPRSEHEVRLSFFEHERAIRQGRERGACETAAHRFPGRSVRCEAGGRSRPLRPDRDAGCARDPRAGCSPRDDRGRRACALQRGPSRRRGRRAL